MKVRLEYGRTGLDIDVPSHATVLEPRFAAGLPNEAAAFADAVAAPIGSPPLRDIVRSTDRVAIVIPDITRPFPSDRVLPWLLRELAHVSSGNITIVNGTGSHRANTPEELEGMVGRDILTAYRVVNHNAYKPEGLELAGHTRDGHPVMMNREYVQADRRIVLGFIEPHFFAGFSGGFKGVFPAVADIDAIMHYHRASVIGDPHSTWGQLEDNPTQAQIRDIGALLPVDFCINVTLNRKREITRCFCGRVAEAHEQGCAFARDTAMAACPHTYPVVITTNGGYPLDQNLYQTVKGMSAAAEIVSEGGLILCAARCNDGFPAHGNFRKLLFDHASPQAILDTIQAPGFSMYDQWEAQKLAMVQLKARVALYSDLEAADVERAHLEPVEDLGAFLSRELKAGGNAPLAILPEGPMTIPYLAGSRRARADDV